MSTESIHLRAILEALNEPSEFHGRSARIAFDALISSGFGEQTAAYYTARSILSRLEADHRGFINALQISGRTTLSQKAADDAAHARRQIVLANLRALIASLKPEAA